MYTPGYRSWESGFYAQDDWRVNSRLTLNLGLRYDIFTPRTEQYNRLANFDPISSVILIAGKNSNSSAGVSTDYGGIAPRLGFAATLGHGMVLRGGWGISYFPGDFGSGVNLKNPPFTSTITCGTSTTGDFGNTGCPAGTGTLSQGPPRPLAPSQFPTDSNGNIDLARIQPSTIQAVESKFRASYNYQFNATLEKQFGNNVVSVGYIGTRGHNLAMIIPDINRALPSGSSIPNPRPYSLVAPSLTTIGYFAFQGRATYNGLQVSFNRRFSRGLSLTSGFTYGDGKSNVTGTSTSTGAYGNKIGPFAQAIRNVQDYDWATSDFNVKYRWTLAGNYELPFGRSLRGASALAFSNWQVNGTASWQTGLPFTVTDQTAVAGVVGLSAERPNLVRSDIRVSNPTVGSAGQFLDASAFSLPAPYTLGNSPRNVGAGPNQSIISGSLFKIFPIRERFNLQFRTECFNVANHPFFGNPNTSFGNPNFGKITTTAGGYTPRQLQFALKLQF